MLEWKKKQFWNPWKISYKMYKIFFHFLFRFLLKTKKNNEPPPFFPPLPPILGGSSAASPLKIWDVMPPYLKTLFEQKTEIW